MGLEDPTIHVRIWNNQAWSFAHGNFAHTNKKISQFTEQQLFQMAIDNLNKFSYIGLVENFEFDRKKIFKDLGIPFHEQNKRINVTSDRPKREDLPYSTQLLLRKLTEVDWEVYNAIFSKKNRKKNMCTDFKENDSSLEKKQDEFDASCKNDVELSKNPSLNIIDFENTQKALHLVRKDYLDLIIKTIAGTIYKDFSSVNGKITPYDHVVREYGCDWPLQAHSMAGLKRLENLRLLTESIIGNNIPGDLIETGVWRGGACILMRAVLYTYGVTDRKIWVADSFAGLPEPDEKMYPSDAGSNFHSYPELSISMEEVQQNFEAYGLMNEQVMFLKGWFKDTLPQAPIEKLALMRLDGDMYESTMDALKNLYHKLSPGGYVIIDDYHVVSACKQAVHDFFEQNSINPQLEEIDGVGVFWKKLA